MDGGAWWATAHGVAKSRTRLSDFTFTFTFRSCINELRVGFHCDCSQQQYLHGTNMASASVYVPRVSHCYTAIPASPQDSPRPAGRSSPGSYQITAFALGPSACEILCVPLQSEVSISSRPLELPKLSPLAFKVKCSRGYCPPSAGPRLRSYIWGSELSLL